jgi:outer membrane protein TolC
LFDSTSFRFFTGPSLSWDIFNYGRLKNRVRAQDARFQQLVILYRQTVIQAYQEVEDAMVGFLRTQDRVGHLSSSVKASKRSVDLSLIQYTEGIVDYQRVLDSQRDLTNQQDLLASNTGSVVINLIALYKGLGGGWQIREGQDFIPAKTKEEMRQRTGWGKLLSKEQQDLPPQKRNRVRLPDW